MLGNIPSPARFKLSTNLSISSRCKKSVKIRLVATCRLQTCLQLLKQLVASLWVTSIDNQLAPSLLTTCVTSRTATCHQLVNSFLQLGSRLVANCVFLCTTSRELERWNNWGKGAHDFTNKSLCSPLQMRARQSKSRCLLTKIPLVHWRRAKKELKTY